MSKLVAGRPSVNKKALSLRDVQQEEKLKRINFDLPESQHRELKKRAAEQGTTIRQILQDLLDEWLSPADDQKHEKVESDK